MNHNRQNAAKKGFKVLPQYNNNHHNKDDIFRPMSKNKNVRNIITAENKMNNNHHPQIMKISITPNNQVNENNLNCKFTLKKFHSKPIKLLGNIKNNNAETNDINNNKLRVSGNPKSLIKNNHHQIMNKNFHDNKINNNNNLNFINKPSNENKILNSRVILINPNMHFNNIACNQNNNNNSSNNHQLHIQNSNVNNINHTNSSNQNLHCDLNNNKHVMRINIKPSLLPLINEKDTNNNKNKLFLQIGKSNNNNMKYEGIFNNNISKDKMIKIGFIKDQNSNKIFANKESNSTRQNFNEKSNNNLDKGNFNIHDNDLVYKIKDYFSDVEQNSQYRSTMEDFLDCNENLYFDKKNEKNKISYFGLFDGFGGNTVSQYLKENFQKYLLNNINLQLKTFISGKKNQPFLFNIENILIESINQIEMFIDKNLQKSKECGSTATISLFYKNAIYTANLGNSSCYLIYKGKTMKMSKDHDTKNPDEVNRIKQEGGMIFNKRVGGSLNVTRAVGAGYYKDCGVICRPTLNKKVLQKNISYTLIICSDGVWDVVNEGNLFDLVYGINPIASKDENTFKRSGNSQSLCENIIKMAKENNSNDNISCIVVNF